MLYLNRSYIVQGKGIIYILLEGAKSITTARFYIYAKDFQVGCSLKWHFPLWYIVSFHVHIEKSSLFFHPLILTNPSRQFFTQKLLFWYFLVLLSGQRPFVIENPITFSSFKPLALILLLLINFSFPLSSFFWAQKYINPPQWKRKEPFSAFFKLKKIRNRPKQSTLNRYRVVTLANLRSITESPGPTCGFPCF